MIKFNPFLEYSIAGYDQYKSVPFIEIKGVGMIKKTIEGRIRDKFAFPERLLLIGQRGIGKTSTLFFIKDILDKANVQNFIFTRLVEDAEQFRITTEEYLDTITKKPVFIMVDFPDSVETKNFKEFLNFIWSLLTHKNSKNINLIFALNIGHYEDSLAFSETLGKFHPIYLHTLTSEETKKLIDVRLKKSGDKNFFDMGTKELVFDYSKGIPRNIVCASKDLVDACLNKKQVTKKMAEEILKKSYLINIIYDRIEDLFEREQYLNVVSVIENHFKGKVSSQELLVNVLKDKFNIGRNKTLFYVDQLNKFGLITLTRGGSAKNRKVILLK